MLLTAVIFNLWAAFPGVYITWQMTMHTEDVSVHDKCPHAAGLPECTVDARASSEGFMVLPPGFVDFAPKQQET